MAGRPIRRARLTLVKEEAAEVAAAAAAQPSAKKGPPERFTAEVIAKTLTQEHGMVACAAQKLGCSVRMVNRYIERYDLCKAALHEARELQGDRTEKKIFEAIERGESWAITLYATTQLRHRGYGKQGPAAASGTAASGTTKKLDARSQPRSLSIDYDAYNRAYEEAIEVIQGANHASPDAS
jgi:hypothetical protein